MNPYERYSQARVKADRQDRVARLLGKDVDLLPFEAVAQALQAYQQIPHSAPRMIPIDRIVGSVGRYRDFSRGFLPREGIRRDRWVQIDRAMNSAAGLPPIEVYQIDDVYFVSDGNHRVSVARANGFEDIEAYVTQVDVDVDLEPGDTLNQAIIKAERTHFLAETKLAENCRGFDICFTAPGGYGQLLEHIRVHRYFMHVDHPDMWQITFEQAAEDWYEEVYTPIVTAIRRQDLLSHFRGHTEADLYIAVSARLFQLRKAGADIDPELVVSQVGQEAQETRPTLLRAVQHLLERFAEMAGRSALPAGVGAEWVAAPPAADLAAEPPAPATAEQQIEQQRALAAAGCPPS